ncbi:MAG: CBS domain-containing protein [Gammaproteobacteria bacterium]|nr:CBS domain-containing protein [Gammaproteobacteria bacterium]
MNNWIKDIMATDVPIADCDDSVAEVEELLASSELPGLPVLNPDHSVFGILTTAEIMRFHSASGNSLAVHAWEICHTRHCLLRMDADIDDAMALYTQQQCRIIAVIDMQNRFVGLITPETLLQSYLEPKRARRDLDPERPGVTLLAQK